MNNTNTELLPAVSPVMPVEARPTTVSESMELMRCAVESKADVATMERIMAVRRELRAEAAKEAYDAALAAFQSECPVISKGKAVMDKDGGFARYKYAPLDDIVKQVKDLLNKHGFSYKINAAVENEWVLATCTATHRMGHSEDSSFKVPIDPKAFMSAPQKFGAALTFAKRYAFCNAFGILTGDEDNDAPQARPKPKGPSTLAGSRPISAVDRGLKLKLVSMTASVHMCKGSALDDRGRRALEQWLIDENIISDTETLAELAGDRLAEVVSKVENRGKK